MFGARAGRALRGQAHRGQMICHEPSEGIGVDRPAEVARAPGRIVESGVDRFGDRGGIKEGEFSYRDEIIVLCELAAATNGAN